MLNEAFMKEILFKTFLKGLIPGLLVSFWYWLSTVHPDIQSPLEIVIIIAEADAGWFFPIIIVLAVYPVMISLNSMGSNEQNQVILSASSLGYMIGWIIALYVNGAFTVQEIAAAPALIAADYVEAGNQFVVFMSRFDIQKEHLFWIVIFQIYEVFSTVMVYVINQFKSAPVRSTIIAVIASPFVAYFMFYVYFKTRIMPFWRPTAAQRARRKRKRAIRHPV